MKVIETIGLKKIYGKGATSVLGLDSSNISINKGEFVAIVGPSGSGKSTLLHLLGGLDKPTVGEVIFEGKSLYKMNENELALYRLKKIGFIFQYYNLIPVLTAKENITLPIRLDNKKVDNKYIDDLMNFLGIYDRQNHLPNAMSGGQQQRVAIARALANKPSIIFADEPTGNLDTKTSIEVLDLLKKSKELYNQTMVIITHDSKVAEVADRQFNITDGVISVTTGRNVAS